MPNLYTLAQSAPWLVFGLALLAAWVLVAALRTAFLCWNRRLRHRNIAVRGWPPAHLDADGDFKPEPEPKSDD